VAAPTGLGSKIRNKTEDQNFYNHLSEDEKYI